MLVTLAFLLSSPLHAATELPSIGESTTTTSTAEEKQLGETWLRLYRRQVPVNSDPLLVDYTEKLLQKLSKQNPEAGDSFSLVIVDNDALNAFAVPGGIIGINSGLFHYALTEDQFASVLAHELAHLSQRHYARGIEQQKGQQLVSMAALLASLVVAATTKGDAGIAALQATRAGIIDQQLRFSRAFEEEADRIGFSTLVASGFDPHAMVDMFEQMQRASRFSTEPPEFLLTHPITAKRIADTENRAREFPNQQASSSLDYDLARSRVLFSEEDTPQQAISRFENELRGFSPSEAGSRYGLVLALIANKDYPQAEENLAPLLTQYPDNTALIIAQSDIEAGSNKLSAAITRIQQALQNHPDSYALTIQYSRLLATNNDNGNASRVLNNLRQQRPNDPFVWYNLAEVAGLAGDILMLHKARAEYFILYGDFDNAENQLDNLVKKFPDNTNEVAIAKQRLEDIKVLRKVLASYQ
jgi:predicted Zn-dependent protease